jgi:hypothetical protein
MFIKNEAYDPTNIENGAIDEYVTNSPQLGRLPSMFNISHA